MLLVVLLVLSFSIQLVAAEPKGTLRVALSTYPNSLDIPVGAERNAHNVGWQLFNSLVWINEETRVVPALAESWKFSEHMSYDKILRNGILRN